MGGGRWGRLSFRFTFDTFSSAANVQMNFVREKVRSSAPDMLKSPVLTLNVQAVGVLHMDGRVQNFINHLECKTEFKIRDDCIYLMMTRNRSISSNTCEVTPWSLKVACGHSRLRLPR